MTSKEKRLLDRKSKRQKKLERAKRGNKRQYDLFKKTGKQGHLREAKRWRKEILSHNKAIRKLNSLIKKERERQKKKLARAWGGSKKVMVEKVRPVAKEYGLTRTSSKRGAKHYLTLLNPSSDHSVLSTKSFADDYGTYDGSSFAHAVADALGISGYSTGNYNSYYITVDGKTFRVQILWAVSGHYNHVHVGIKRV